MIICPNCQHKEMTGTLFCSQCGTQLFVAGTLDTQKIRVVGNKKDLEEITEPFQSPTSAAVDTWVSLHMVESGQIIPLTERNEFTLGRVTEGQPIMPDVDLTPFNAYANGVSRLHAVLKRVKNIVIMDLGSSNGTYVNGSHIIPHIEYPLAHGDIISLGKLKIQVLFGQDNQRER